LAGLVRWYVSYHFNIVAIANQLQPGWWFTVEATTTSHLLHHFKRVIKDALSSKKETRVEMRACSAKQRFPVAQWLASLESLQNTAIKIRQKEAVSKYDRSRLKTPMRRIHSPGFHQSTQIDLEVSTQLFGSLDIEGVLVMKAHNHRHLFRRHHLWTQSALCRIPFRPNTASPSFRDSIRLEEHYPDLEDWEDRSFPLFRHHPVFVLNEICQEIVPGLH
jgi:hypothetical protein